MRAAQINEYGDKEVLKIALNVEKPLPAAGQVLVEVRAAGVNPFDYKVRSGLMQSMAPLALPATLGGDVAGTVAAIGEGVPGFAVGDAVYGQANALSGKGSYAEFAPVKAAALAPKPRSIDFMTAAALPLAGVSAYQALVDHAHLQSGQKVLIHGGAGGIGSFAIQIAHHLGAYVATTALLGDADFVRSLGADEVIDYKTQDFSHMIQDYDVVYDTVGGETTAKSYLVLKPGGVLVSMVSAPDEALVVEHKVTMVQQSTQVTAERLARLAELVDAAAVKVKVDKIFPLEQAAEALAYIESGKHHGKVVLKV